MSLTLPDPVANHENAGGQFYDQTNCEIKTLVSRANNYLDMNSPGSVYMLPRNGGIHQKWFLSGVFSNGNLNRFFVYDMGAMNNLDSNAGGNILWYTGNVYGRYPNEGTFQMWEFIGLNGQACPVNAGTCQATIKNVATAQILDITPSRSVTTFPYYGKMSQRWEITCNWTWW